MSKVYDFSKGDPNTADCVVVTTFECVGNTYVALVDIESLKYEDKDANNIFICKVIFDENNQPVDVINIDDDAEADLVFERFKTIISLKELEGILNEIKEENKNGSV